VPVLSRRQAAGPPSARGLLLTLLGEFVLPSGEPAWTSAAIIALARLGVEEKTARQALMRTAAAGWLAAEKSGRRTRWHLTPAARRLLTDGAARIYSHLTPAEPWDGRWLLISARIPDQDRRARHLVRTRLSWAGFGSLGPGLWISSHPDRSAEALGVLQDAGVADGAQVFTATRTGPGDAAAMAGQAWDLAGIEREYEDFLAAFAEPSPDPLAGQIALVHAWRRFPAIDPALPRELLPQRWSGLAAAQFFARRHADQATAAHAEWTRLNPPGTPQSPP
jgi:phenylacetic acid degradation operon negative regulatory protein